jgi:methyl-accepting chemotaxis protein
MKRWKQLSLRTKIGAVMLPMFAPVVAIVAISYSASHGASLSSSQRLSEMMVERAASEVEGHVTACANQFLQWTSEDVYGMAIEFDTVTELAGRMREMVAGSPFAGILVTTPDGAVVTAAANAGRPEPAAGKKVAAVPALAGVVRGAMQQLTRPQLDDLQLPFPTSFAMHMECKDSSGKPNGHFVAVLDWPAIEAVVGRTGSLFERYGFPNGSGLMVDASDGRVLATSGRKADETALAGFGAPGAEQSLATRYGGEACRARLAAVQHGDAPLPITMVNVLTEADVFAEVQTLMWQSLALTIGALVLLLAIGYGVGTWIAKPIRAAAAQLERMSQGQGDLTVRLPVTSEDELGMLATGFNRFIVGLGELILTIRHEVNLLGRGASQVMDASQQSSQRSVAQAQRVTQINQSTEEIATSTTANAEEAKGASSASASARGATEEGRQAMAKMAKAIAEVKDASTRASKIIGVIDSIAFQVNLLALNAAVEAARAGDAGRGFAVVAEEVRSLAQRSASAARDSAAVITECDQRAQGGVEIVAGVEGVLARIDQQVLHLDNAVSQIAEASRTQAEGLQAVTRNVAQMDEITSQGAAQAEELAAAAAESAQRVEALKNLAAKFRIDEQQVAGAAEVEATAAAALAG